MARGSLDDSLIGVGSALRKARELRRLTLDEASRDTKLRVDQLRALEEEDFELLLGEPYVRGALRTYSTYLGLNPDKVAGVYALHTDEPDPLPPPAKVGRIERAIMATRIRDDQRLAVAVAVVVLGAGIWLGVLSRGHSAPAPAVLPSVAATPQPLGASIEAVLTATRDVDIRVVADGVSHSAQLVKGESMSFTADRTLAVSVADGGAVRLTVSGIDYGVPGSDGKPWHHSYSLGAGASSSPSG